MIYIQIFMKIGTGVQAIWEAAIMVLLTEGFMKYADEMGSGSTIYIPSFIKTGSGIQKLLGRDTLIDTDSKLIS
jgi:hypothetical protein